MWPILTVLLFSAFAAPRGDARDPTDDARADLDDARADLRELADFLEHVHPDVTGPLAIPDDLTTDPVGLTRAAHAMCAALGDGHLRVGWAPGMSRTQFLPVRPVWVGDRAFVAAGPSQLVGEELLAIDGHPVATLRSEVDALVAVDGRRTGPVEAALRRDPWRFLHLVVPPRDAYTLTLGPDERTLTVDAIADVSHLVSPPSALPSWEQHGRHTILRVPAMSAAPDFERIIEDGFRALDVTSVDQPSLDPSSLVLDLRGNEGGLRDRGVWIVAHLVTTPFSQWASSSVQVQRVPRRLRRQVTVPFGLPDRPILRLLARGESWTRPGDPGAPAMQPRTPHFAGDVTVWVDGGTNSAAIETAVSLKHARPDVRIVGEDTGGACDAHMGETPVVFTTSRFQLPVLVSLQQIELVPVPGCVPGQGLPLDERVTWTVEDVLAGRDPWIATLER